MKKPRLTHDGQLLPPGVNEIKYKSGEYKYQAIVSIDHKQTYLGYYQSIMAAKKAREEYVDKVTHGKGRQAGHIDLTGRRFGQAVAIKPTNRRNSYQAVMWEMHCDCGQYFLASTSKLTMGRIKSCGHARKQIAKHVQEQLDTFQKFGTATSSLTSKKPKTNTSGYKNISEVKMGNYHRYKAEMTVAGKRHYLGQFKTIDEARVAVAKAREKYVKPKIDEIKRYKNKKS